MEGKSFHNHNSLEAVGLTSGQVPCCPRPQSSLLRVFEVDDNSREETINRHEFDVYLDLRIQTMRSCQRRFSRHSAANAANSSPPFCSSTTITFVFSLHSYLEVRGS